MVEPNAAGAPNVLNSTDAGAGDATKPTGTTNQPAGNQPPTGTTTPAAGTTLPAGDTNGNNAGAGGTGGAKTGADEGGQPPADWEAVRARIANGDDKLLKRLSRYGTLEEALKAGIEAQNKLSSTRANQAPGTDATPEEIAAYRKANGVPEAAEGYDVALPDGLVLGEADRPLAEKFMAVAHKNNLPNAVVNDIIAQQLQAQEELVAAQQESDAQLYEETTNKLRSPEVWGGEFVKNRNMIVNLLNSAPPGVSDAIQGARLPDGSVMANNPDVLIWLNSLARQVNPTATLTDGNRSMPVAQIESELTELKGLMGDTNSKYWKGDQAAKLQERFRELVKAQQNLQS